MFVPDHVAPAEAAGRDERVQVAAASLGEGIDPDLPQAAAAHPAVGPAVSVKAEAFFHLSANFNYPLMCVLSVLMAPSMVIRYNMGWYEMLLIDMPLFFAATASVANFYMVCQRELYDDWTDAAEVPAVPDVDRHRPRGEQHQGGVRGAVPQAERVRAHAEIPRRRRRRRVEPARSTARRRRPAADRGGARPLLHRRRCSTRSPMASTARCRS